MDAASRPQHIMEGMQHTEADQHMLHIFFYSCWHMCNSG